VLSRPRGAEAEVIEASRAMAADALELLVREGLERAMVSVNTRG
jgi:peptidyl-tRNA hydrolase